MLDLRLFWVVIFGVMTLGSHASAETPKILVILSGADSVTLKKGKTHPTGYYLSEFIVPVSKLVRLGYQVTIATPTGSAPFIDRTSDSAQFFKDESEYKTLRALHDRILREHPPSALSRIPNSSLSKFDAVFFPGGHAPLTDLAKNEDVSRVLHFFHRQDKITALICHGPAALLAARNPAWPYAGYRMTGFSTAEEQQAETGALGGEVEYYLDQALRDAGGNVSVESPWKPYAVRDRELITGQNPQSDHVMTDALLTALAEGQLAKAKPRAFRSTLNTLNEKSLYEIIPFPKNWREGFTNVYIGARKSGVSRSSFFKALIPHLTHAKTVFGKAGMRGYLVLSNGDHEIAFMNWSSKEAADSASSAPGREAVLKESGAILETFGIFPIEYPERLKGSIL